MGRGEGGFSVHLEIHFFSNHPLLDHRSAICSALDRELAFLADFGEGLPTTAQQMLDLLQRFSTEFQRRRRRFPSEEGAPSAPTCSGHVADLLVGMVEKREFVTDWELPLVPRFSSRDFFITYFLLLAVFRLLQVQNGPLRARLPESGEHGLPNGGTFGTFFETQRIIFNISEC